MNNVRNMTAHLNPGQVPVLTMDQPLFALGKRLHWNFPESLGEDHYVLLMGALHIEMAILHRPMIDSWLQDSGWLFA